MGGFKMRRFILTATMLFCQVALADEPKPTDQPELQAELPFKLLAAIKPVSLEEVDKVVEANDRAVQACNRKGRRVDTLAVLMTMTIDGDGKVSAVEAAPEDQDNGKAPPETACLMRVAKKLKFPATGTVSHVSYPFMIVSRVKSPLLSY
jgi:hypothetical protein